MKSLNEDLKTGQLKQIYLLYGEEAYLKKQYKDKLHYAIVPPDDTMNYAYYEGKGINAKEVIDLAETLPFFAERRLFWKTADFLRMRLRNFRIISRNFRRPLL